MPTMAPTATWAAVWSRSRTRDQPIATTTAAAIVHQAPNSITRTAVDALATAAWGRELPDQVGRGDGGSFDRLRKRCPTRRVSLRRRVHPDRRNSSSLPHLSVLTLIYDVGKL